MQEKELLEAVERAKPSMTYLNNDEVVADVVKEIKKNTKRREATVKEIMDKNEKLSDRVSAIRMTRNNNMHEAIPQFLTLLADKENPLVIRLNMAEALGWYIYSYRKQEIIDGFNKILKEQAQELDPKLKAEMVQTINRLK